MNHPHPDALLLFASGELTEPRMTDVASHVQTCAPCRDMLAQLDQSLVALGGAWAPPRRSRSLARSAVWGGVALAAAAAVVTVVLIQLPNEPQRAAAGWTPTTRWSATAGYVAGGRALVDIDAQLTRLEQESYYGRP